jgi:hypothetical protein
MNNLTIIMGRVNQDLLKIKQIQYEMNQIQNKKVKKEMRNFRKGSTQDLNLKVGVLKT